MAAARLFTIPPSAPFLPTLVHSLLDGKLVHGFPKRDDPLSLASATLYLPTRRACRLARDVFLEVLQTDAAILPHIVPIGDIDEDEIVFAESTAGVSAADALDLPPALGGTERKLLLTRLIMQWVAGIAPTQGAPLVANTPVAAWSLASDLARLIDDMTTRKVSWKRLDDLVPQELDIYWQLTLDFLRTTRADWLKILESLGTIETAERRDLLIEAEAARLQSHSGPVIAAGSTGSMPSTAMLLETIAKMSNGAVVLPGLDTDLDEASWVKIAGDSEMAPAIGHPQFALRALLQRIGVNRESVEALAPSEGREALLSEALRPAATTEHWQTRLKTTHFETRTRHALDRVTVIEAANPEEEALAIAVALREVLEHREKIAALVTPDRNLARRVRIALERWNVAVDDSAGEPLDETPAGIFARLAAETSLHGFEPVTLLALLKHPMFRLGQPSRFYDDAISALERSILRGTRPRPRSKGLLDALATLRREQMQLHRNDPRRALSEAALAEADALARRIAQAAMPLEMLEGSSQLFADLCRKHRSVIETLSQDEQGRNAFDGDDGEILASLFDEIISSASTNPIRLPPSDYVAFFQGMMAERVVRKQAPPQSQVRIYGPLEARLQHADRIVLGGLVEGTWPPETQSDPWLSRPMRQQLGLDLPERRIGLSAHDFAQGFGADEVFLTHAAKQGGAPTVASRFIQRLAAVIDKASWKILRDRGARYLAWARGLDDATPEPALTRPEPRPPREARPKSLTVTEIEDWLRDPYTIYAKHVLSLLPLDPVDTPAGARDRGTAVHAAISDFTKASAIDPPDDSVSALLEFGRKHFAALVDYPEARAFWWPRFERMARFFVDWERKRREAIQIVRPEHAGAITIPLPNGGAFQLRARADRVELRPDGRAAIVDFKTGNPPSDKQVRTGLSPQLTLEAAILRQGGFKDFAAGLSIKELLYVALRGDEHSGDPKPIDFEGDTPDSQADFALERLRKIVERFDDEATPYRSLVHPMWKFSYGVYDHLARVKEWSASGEDEADGE
ncbi:MAG: double-strand break repair protein AddB [Pseudorhodoplanes sp.]